MHAWLTERVALGYDLNSQVTSFRSNGTLSGGVVTGGALTTLNFDASGNRTSVIDGTTTSYTVNNLNEYATITGVAAPTYDGLGRQIAYNTGSGSTTILSVWDGWNLAAAYASGSNTPLIRCVYAGNDLIRTTWPQLLYYYADAQGEHDPRGEQHWHPSGALYLRPLRQADLLYRGRDRPDQWERLRGGAALHRPGLVQPIGVILPPPPLLQSRLGPLPPARPDRLRWGFR
ncbi:MAG: hypothetical protein ABIU29_00660 [Chthoniobacterales bacterium]